MKTGRYSPRTQYKDIIISLIIICEITLRAGGLEVIVLKALAFAITVGCAEAELEAGSSALPAAATLSLTGKRVWLLGVSRIRPPVALPDTSPGCLLRGSKPPLTMGEPWKGVILTVGLGPL